MRGGGNSEGGGTVRVEGTVRGGGNSEGGGTVRVEGGGNSEGWREQ